MKLHVFNTTEGVIKNLAGFFVEVVNDSISRKGGCTIVLSGGSSPKKLYELLTTSSYRSKINWKKIWFFFGDERYVHFSDHENNGRMAKRSLFDPLQIDESNIFYIDTSLPPGDAAKDYGQKIKKHFNEHPGQFDLILLGLGDNAHTASLFPYTEVIHEEKALVSAPYIEELNAYRITMTPAALKNSLNIAFLVYGKNKAQAVYNILKAPVDIDRYPAQVINEKTAAVNWFLDKAAASMLDTSFISGSS